MTLKNLYHKNEVAFMRTQMKIKISIKLFNFSNYSKVLMITNKINQFLHHI